MMCTTKRQLIRVSGSSVAGLIAAVAAPTVMPWPARGEDKSAGEKLKESVTGRKQEVTPPEDLMREHGVLDRVLLSMRLRSANFQRMKISIRPS